MKVQYCFKRSNQRFLQIQTHVHWWDHLTTKISRIRSYKALTETPLLKLKKKSWQLLTVPWTCLQAENSRDTIGHKMLEGILQNSSWKTLSALQRIIMKLQKYSVDVKHRLDEEQNLPRVESFHLQTAKTKSCRKQCLQQIWLKSDPFPKTNKWNEEKNNFKWEAECGNFTRLWESNSKWKALKASDITLCHLTQGVQKNHGIKLQQKHVLHNQHNQEPLCSRRLHIQI